jgi:hypothetical protein
MSAPSKGKEVLCTTCKRPSTAFTAAGECWHCTAGHEPNLVHHAQVRAAIIAAREAAA